MNVNDEKAIMQNLIDAGCGQSFISEFMEDFRKDNTSKELKLLAAHRRSLLDNLHKEQKRIDCLDYLVYQMTKENSV
ncbi:MAG: hypothetical protein K2N06_06820 [Oscillospiraceae bacterium]|nr:hypothetical protein [Oscillospiraceae bacterium]